MVLFILFNMQKTSSHCWLPHGEGELVPTLWHHLSVPGFLADSILNSHSNKDFKKSLIIFTFSDKHTSRMAIFSSPETTSHSCCRSHTMKAAVSVALQCLCWVKRVSGQQVTLAPYKWPRPEAKHIHVNNSVEGGVYVSDPLWSSAWKQIST